MTFKKFIKKNLSANVVKEKFLKMQVWVHLSGLRIHLKAGGKAWLMHIQEENIVEPIS